jgi:hypothetical protein
MTDSTHETTFGCLLKECNTKNDFGGGLYVVSPLSTGSVGSCVFDSGTATTYCGGLTLSRTSDIGTYVFLDYCFYYGNQCGESSYGGDIVFSGSSFTASSWDFCDTRVQLTKTSNRCTEDSLHSLDI